MAGTGRLLADYARPKEEPGIDGAIQRRPEFKASTINTVDVPSVDEYTARVVIPGVGYFAYCQDTEGNPFGIIQNDPKAM